MEAGRVITNGMTQPPQHTPASAGRRSLGDRRARERRVLILGLAISALLHAAALLVVSRWLEPGPAPTGRRPTALIAEPPPGMRAVELRMEPGPTVPEPPDRPDPEEPVERERVALDAAPPSRDTLPADSRTAADRLAPRIVDPRLWQPMILVPREPTLADVEARIAAAVELLSDSALAEADAAMRARDWTVEDGKGGRWGISPGKLHLGELTLPLPIWFPVDPEAAAAEAMWYELDQQLERARILESFEDRVRAIRERRERERAEARKSGNGG